MKNTIWVYNNALGFERDKWLPMSIIGSYMVSYMGDMGINGDVGGAYEHSYIGDEDLSIDSREITGNIR